MAAPFTAALFLAGALEPACMATRAQRANLEHLLGLIDLMSCHFMPFVTPLN